MNFFTIQSGSSGNTTYIGHNDYGILIDAGGSYRTIISALKGAGTDIKRIAAIFITHEHSDHIKALPRILNKNKIPVFANKNTLRSIMAACPFKDEKLFFEMETGKSAGGGDIVVTSFKTPHDSVESVGYTISAGGNYISVVTDIGCITETIVENIHKSKLVLIESNHDREMLVTGNYPHFLKRRILSDNGHLSNEDCAQMALKLVKSGVESIVLGHLSDQNNTPDKAFDTNANLLEQNDIKIGKDIKLTTAPRLSPSEVFDV